jgi:hypothetical protein
VYYVKNWYYSIQIHQPSARELYTAVPFSVSSETAVKVPQLVSVGAYLL